MTFDLRCANRSQSTICSFRTLATIFFTLPPHTDLSTTAASHQSIQPPWNQPTFSRTRTTTDLHCRRKCHDTPPLQHEHIGNRRRENERVNACIASSASPRTTIEITCTLKHHLDAHRNPNRATKHLQWAKRAIHYGGSESNSRCLIWRWRGTVLQFTIWGPK